MTQNPIGNRGVLLLGFGKPRYREMARTVAKTLRMHSPQTRIAVITDHPDDLRDDVDLVVPFESGLGDGFAQKLSLDHYSPFDETLFIDSDCLVVRDIDFLWRLYEGVSFGVSGKQVTDGTWFGADLEKVREAMGIAGSMPQFNAGLVYWKSDETARSVFKIARELVERYAELGFKTMRGSAVTDEPLLSLSMALQGLEVVTDDGSTMKTPLGMTGPLTVDVLRGRAHMLKNGRHVDPAIVHFCGDWAEGFEYRREVLKIKVAGKAPRPLWPAVAAGVDAGAGAVRVVRRGARKLKAS